MTEESEAIDPQMPQPKIRPVGGTEYSWCIAVPGGTGITVLGLLFSKPPQIPLFQTTLHSLQNSHPILRSKIRLDSSTNTFYYLTPPNPQIQITSFDLESTSQIIGDSDQNDSHIDSFHLILEHEMNRNTWHDPSDSSSTDTHVFHVSVYTVSDHRWAMFLRLHTSACDRTAAATVLRKLLVAIGGGSVGGKEGEGTDMELTDKDEVNLAIEDLIPKGMANKPFWARGLDVVGYSLNALRLAHLNFVDANSPRSSKAVKLRLNRDETERLIDGCKSRGIKLCGALAAAGMIASWSSKNLPEHQREKYGVVTLVDCRSILDPVLCSEHLGFYHSGILNTHDVCGETLWELAKRSYGAFENAKNNNKHFTDMSDLNYLMCKAIENPGLTPSSSLRTALISVFEESIIDDSNGLHQKLGLEDFAGCASAHGVGPSLALFDTIRGGKLDCACVYPSPLHSREQIEKLVDHMKRILVDSCESDGQ